MDNKEEKISFKFYYIEDGKRVFKKNYHLKRGYCCGSGCRHCPFVPKHVKGSTEVDSE